MSVANLTRSAKKQRGEFLTPRRLAEALVADLPIDAGTSILEPSMGDGSFLLPLARRLAESGNGRQSGGVWGAEIDGALYRKSAENVRRTVPGAADRTHLFHGDFFSSQPASRGWVPWRPGGRLRFICSDTILTIPTMRGLREFLRARGDVDVERIDRFSYETTYPMVTLDFTLLGKPGRVHVDGRELPARDVQRTRNASWGLRPEFTRYFGGPVLGGYMTASSGMILGWTLTDACNALLKNVINHTRNIQSKDFERLPYPHWLAPERKQAAAAAVRALVDEANQGRTFTARSAEVKALDSHYEM